MQNFRNCFRCGSIFSYVSGPPVCQGCREDEEKEFDKVKEYLQEHPGARLLEVASAIGIRVDRLQTYLKDGRLDEVEIAGEDKLTCESCGKEINSGRHCAACKSKVSNQIKDTRSQMDEYNRMQAERERRNSEVRFINKK